MHKHCRHAMLHIPHFPLTHFGIVWEYAIAACILYGYPKHNVNDKLDTLVCKCKHGKEEQTQHAYQAIPQQQQQHISTHLSWRRRAHARCAVAFIYRSAAPHLRSQRPIHQNRTFTAFTHLRHSNNIDALPAIAATKMVCMMYGSKCAHTLLLLHVLERIPPAKVEEQPKNVANRTSNKNKVEENAARHSRQPANNNMHT